MQKNILMIGWGWPPKIEGGLDTHIANLTECLAKHKDIKINLFLPKSNVPKEIPDNLNIHPIPVRQDTSTIEHLIDTVKRYNKAIAETQIEPDIVHAHDWLGTEAAISIKKQKNIPFILTIHSLEYMRAASDNNMTAGTIGKIEKEGIENADLIITVSRSMKQDISKRYSIPKENIKVIPNGPTFTQKKNDTERDKNLIVYCGRLSSQKGLEYLLLAAKDIIAEKQEAKFIILGKGHLEHQLKDLTHLLQIDNNITFKGFVTEEQIQKYYQKAGAVVFPSIYEPFGITILDALTAGAPVITVETAGIAEDLENNTHLIKIRERDSKTLKEAILTILKDQRLAETLSKNARQVANNYSWDKIAEKTRDIYFNR